MRFSVLVLVARRLLLTRRRTRTSVALHDALGPLSFRWLRCTCRMCIVVRSSVIIRSCRHRLLR